MKTINSNELGLDVIEFAEESSMLDLYSGLKTPFSEDTVVLSDVHQAEIESFARAAVGTYGNRDAVKEATMAETLHGVNSLVVRVDCTIVDGHIQPYELEDSPSGIGVTDQFMQATTGGGFKERILDHYGRITGDIPHVIVSGARRHGTDDESVVGSDRYHFTVGDFNIPNIGNEAVIVKAIPGNSDSHMPYLSLQNRCLAPLVTEGDKSYLERLGIVTSIENEDDLLMKDGELASQVIKARLGSMAMGVSIYLAPDDLLRFGKRGTVKSGRLKRDIALYQDQGEGALVQPFESPIQISNSEARNNAILRIFVLMESGIYGSTPTANAIGGAYVARPELIVHGASNAVSGAVLVE